MRQLLLCLLAHSVLWSRLFLWGMERRSKSITTPRTRIQTQTQSKIPQLRFLGQPVPDPSTTVNSLPNYDPWGATFSLGPDEQDYSGIVWRIYEGLHMLRTDQKIRRIERMQRKEEAGRDGRMGTGISRLSGWLLWWTMMLSRMSFLVARVMGGRSLGCRIKAGMVTGS